MFKWVMWAQIDRGKRSFEDAVDLRRKLREEQTDEVEEQLYQVNRVGPRKVTVTSLNKNWRKLPDEVTVPSILNTLQQSSMLH